MATSWYDNYAVCPYYLRDDRHSRIECTGIADDCRLLVQFSSDRDYKTQIETFCCNHYQNCEIWNMLRQIYEEDE